MKANTQEIINKALPILKKAGVTHSSLFGSLVQGEHRSDSDIDILVDLPKSKSLFDFVDLQFKLEEALNRKVDLVEYSTIKPRLKPYILKNQIQII